MNKNYGRWLEVIFLIFVVLGGSAAFVFGSEIVKEKTKNADMTKLLEQITAEKKVLEKEVARYIETEQFNKLSYYTTTTYRDVRTIVVNGKPWQFVHDCEGRPVIVNENVRCEWGISTLSVIGPDLKEKVLVKKMRADDRQLPSDTRDSHIGKLQFLTHSNDPLLLIEFGNYWELEGRNELGGGDFYNYVFRFNDYSLRKLENYPNDAFSQGPVWNASLTFMAFVPVFCHPGCVPVPLAVYDLQRDRIVFSSKEEAYGSEGDLGVAIRPEDYEKSYWEKIEWVDENTLRGVKIGPDGKRRVILWDIEDPKQTNVYGTSE